jgi:drug/metabolite transporter (DMT)-like permease
MKVQAISVKVLRLCAVHLRDRLSYFGDMNPFRGIALKLASVVVFVAMATCIKYARGSVPPGETVFFRSFFAIPVILVWLWRTGELGSGLRAKHPMSHVWRGLIGTCAMAFGFAGLGLLPFPDVTAIGYAAPLLTVIFAAMFLGEQVRSFRIAAVVIGLIGVIVILSPRLGSFTDGEIDVKEAFGAMIVLMSAVFGAMASTFVRRLVNTESTSAIVFWFSVTASVLALLSLPFGWVVPSPFTAFLLVLSGLFGGLGQIFLTSSYRHADAGVIAPFEYTSIMLVLLVSWFLFDELPTSTMLAGSVLVILAGVIIIWRERALGLERSKQRAAGTPGGGV